MCGIAGFQGRFDETLLRKMSALVAHRGPDDDGCCLLGTNYGVPTGLAHRRLSIIDLSVEGRQPMSVRCTRCRCDGLDQLALTYNGEIYNFAELRAQLVAHGHVFHSKTDSEVLIHLWAEHGPAMLGMLNGIFALALCDGRDTGRPAGIEKGDVLVVRDPLGVKPLYYAETDRGVLFASEMKALLAAGISRDLDLTAVQQTLAYLWTPAPRTVLAAVRKLPPGEAMLLRDGKVRRAWTFYDLPYGRKHLNDDAPTIARLVREEVEAAVKRQLVADVPTGAFLSGGLDSSAIVAMMRRATDATPVCYTIRFENNGSIEGAVDDLPYARKVAALYGVELNEVTVGPQMINDLDEMLYHLDEPTADPAALHVMKIADMARTDGIKVLLSGAGGDDIFSGYRRHQSLRLEQLWRHIPQGIRTSLAGKARDMASTGSRFGAAMPQAHRLLKLFSQIDQSADDRAIGYFYWSTDDLRRSLFGPELKALSATTNVSAPLQASLQRISAEPDMLNRMLYLEARHFLADHNLNYTDKMGMARGVEIRVPLLDLELIDLATRIPPGLKQRGGVGKAIFKKAMEPLLPHEVVYRKKTGFGVPLRRWLRLELRQAVDDVLSPASLRRRGLFDPAGVRQLIELDRNNRIDGAYTIFSLLCLELWCRKFVDQPVAPASLPSVAPIRTGRAS